VNELIDNFYYGLTRLRKSNKEEQRRRLTWARSARKLRCRGKRKQQKKNSTALVLRRQGCAPRKNVRQPKLPHVLV